MDRYCEYIFELRTEHFDILSKSVGCDGKCTPYKVQHTDGCVTEVKRVSVWRIKVVSRDKSSSFNRASFLLYVNKFLEMRRSYETIRRTKSARTNRADDR